MGNFKLTFFLALVLVSLFSILIYVTIFDQVVSPSSSSSSLSTSKLIDRYHKKQDYAKLLSLLNASNIKSVQLYTGYYASLSWSQGPGSGKQPFKNCPIHRNCYVFRLPSNMDQRIGEASDGVMVHVPNLVRMPSRAQYKRRPDQLWLFYTHESPRFSYCFHRYSIYDLDDWFNLTCTIKSDFWLYPYNLSRLHDYETMLNEYKKSIVAKPANLSVAWSDKKLALWFISNCGTPSRRETYVKDMLNFTSSASSSTIDIFGSGGCHFKNYRASPCKDDACYKRLYSSYKFYLSFENSKCAHYITEKYFKLYAPDMVFQVDILPVVLGARKQDYLHVAPDEHSFVFAEDFRSAQHLADYLLYLASNRTAYDEYFKWKHDLRRRMAELVEMSGARVNLSLIEKAVRKNPFCEMCAKLHDPAFMSSHASRAPIKISEFYNPSLDCNNPGDPKGEALFKNLWRPSCSS